MIHYYIIDVETTGLKVGYHETTQISIIRCVDRKQLNKYIKAEHVNRASPKALEVTGRTYADLSKGDDRASVVDFCDQFFNEDGASPEERCIVGHNIHRFDRKFLYALWASVDKVFPANLWLDTLPSTKKFALQKGIYSDNFKLDSCLKVVGAVPRPGGHNAVVDTQNTYILWRRLEKDGIDLLPFTQRSPHNPE